MKISLNWLQDFITITEPSLDKIKAVITANTAEVETMETLGAHLENVVVGKVEKIMPHPNADILKLCTVNNGAEKFQVVCAGSNLREGMKVAFGQVGAVVRWHGAEVMKLEKVKIRGEESNGMICASDEIGLAEMFPAKAEREIVDLSHLDVPLGTPVAKALGMDDVVMHIDNHALTNRGDLFSHIGFAQEFVANGLAKWKKREPFEIPKNNSPAPITVNAPKEISSRYMGVYITGIQVAESPEWMKQRLTAVGIRPLGNIIDITNYVMIELGIPNHAFDLDQVKGKTWTQRMGKKGERVVTLDKKSLEVTPEVMVIDDGNELFDLCGIMGGYQSGVKPNTNRIWLHTVVYDPIKIRRSARATGQITEAGIIYEKGIDNEKARQGLARCVELILKLCPSARVASNVLDIKNYKPEVRKISLRHSQIKRLIGCEIKPKKAESILKDLGFSLTKIKTGYFVTIPSWRLNDVNLEADIIEEVGRIYGYDNIPFSSPIIDGTPVPINARRELEKVVKEQLMAMGFDEIYTFAFLGQELLRKCGMAQNDMTIEISNPISSDISLMRQSLLPRMLETIEQTWRHEEKFRLFELSKTYFKKGNESEELSTLIMATAGEDFRILQGVVEAVGLNVIPNSEKKSNNPACHPGRSGDLIGRGKIVGSLYEVHPQVLKTFDIKSRVVVAEVDLETIHAMNLPRWSKFKELPRFPSVKLDISIAIPCRELASKYFDIIFKTDKTLIEHIDFIDEYAGEKIGHEKRGLTYSITYRSADRTLTEEEVDKIHAKVLANLKNNGALIR